MSDVKKMLKSVRFWFSVVFVISYFLGKEELLNTAITQSLQAFTALGLAIRTWDRTIDTLSTVDK